MKISLTSIPVKDPIAAFKFYTEVLDFQEKMYMPDMMLAIVVSAEEPNGTAILLEPRGGYGSGEYYEGIYNAGLPVIVFGSDDVQVDYEKLKERSVVFKQEPTKTPYGTQAIFDDTCGNYIQIHQA
jgi:predicted enzyme related to lactoylglutathione lyase